MVTRKTLSGAVYLTGSPCANNDVYLFVPPNPNTLQNQVLNEVYLQCDSTLGPIFILVPSIIDLGGFATKIYVTDVAGTSSTNAIYIADSAIMGMGTVNLINQSLIATLNSNYTTIKLEVGSNNNWFLTSGQGSGETYVTSVQDTTPYIITPSMIASNVLVESTNYIGLPLNGYKIGGALDLQGEQNDYSIYIGTVESLSNYGFAPWKLSGIVTAYDNSGITYAQSSLPIGFLVDSTNSLIPTTSYIIADPFSYVNGDGDTVYGLDLYFITQITGTVLPDGSISGQITFEYEFLFPTVFASLNFTIY